MKSVDIWQFDISQKQKSEPFLRKVLAHYLPEKNLRIERGEFGKPFLPDFPRCQFNVSHSGEKIVCAVSFAMPVGVDIEKIKTRHSFDGLVKKCFSLAEQNYWFALPEMEKTAVFYDFWTRKEAVVKGIGRGIVLGLNRCEIDLNQRNCFVNLPVCESWFTQQIEIFADYCAVMATPCANVIVNFCDLEK